MISEQDEDMLSYMMDLKVRLGSLRLGEVGERRGNGLTLKTGKGQVSQKEISSSSSTMWWQVEEVRHPSDCCKIMLFFRKNPYFWNKVIIKQYLIDITGKRRLPGWVAEGGA